MMVPVVLIVILVGLRGARPHANASSLAADTADDTARSATLEDAQRFFYNGRYDAAAAVTLALCASRPDDLAARELRTSALHFQIRRALEGAGGTDKTRAWKLCTVCPELMSMFLADTATGQTLARTRLQIDPDDEATLFFLGKLDLNYVWLQLGTLGHKTGWNEYWEARRSLDHVLTQNPANVRARVARAWMDYIVGTRVPRGTRWLLGGGNRQRGLGAVREAVRTASTAPFIQAEAMFALWEMQVRERDVPEAVATARMLARDFPENLELTRFLRMHDQTAATISPADRAP
jgi:hypothetical protein